MRQNKNYIFFILLSILIFKNENLLSQENKSNTKYFDSVFNNITLHRFNSFKTAYEIMAGFDSTYAQQNDSSLYLKNLEAKVHYFQLINSYSTAEEYVLKYIAEAKKSGSNEDIFLAEGQLAKIKLHEGNLIAAENTIKNSLLKIKEKNSFLFLYLSVIDAEIQIAKKNIPEALSTIDNALKTYPLVNDYKLNSWKTLQKLNILKARCYETLNKYNDAILFAHEAYKEDRGKPKDGITVHICCKLASYYSTDGKFYLGQTYMREALRLSENQFFPEFYLLPNKTAAQIYKNKGDFEIANSYNDRAYNLYDSVNYQLQNLLLKDMDAKLAINRKNDELKMQIGINKAQDRFRNYSIVFIIVLIVAIVILLLSYNRNRLLKLKLERNNHLITIQKNDLEELNKLKDRLFSIIAHDLRGPISSLRSILELISQEMITETEFKELTNKLYQRTDITYNLLENLLNWSRIQMRTFNIDLKETSIEKVLEECLSLVNETAQLKNISLVKEMKEDFLLKTEPEMLKAVLRNLLNNAIKFTPDNEKITLSVFNSDGTLKIKIKDMGIGISEENAKKLFKIDQTFTTLGTNNEKGSGLGLLISNDFVRKLGGELTLESKIGEGSTFTIVLPYS